MEFKNYDESEHAYYFVCDDNIVVYDMDTLEDPIIFEVGLN